jgi:hypothetical protein
VQILQLQIFELKISILNDFFLSAEMMNRGLHIDDMCTEEKIYELKFDRNKKLFSLAVAISNETFEPEIDLLFSLLLIRSVDSSLSNISKKRIVNGYTFFGGKKEERERKATQIDSHMLFRRKESDHADGLKLFCRDEREGRFEDFDERADGKMAE